MADLGVAQLHDMREHAEMIANLDPQGPPLIADMDTGYGGKFTSSRKSISFFSYKSSKEKNPQVQLWSPTQFSNTFEPE